VQFTDEEGKRNALALNRSTVNGQIISVTASRFPAIPPTQRGQQHQEQVHENQDKVGETDKEPPRAPPPRSVLGFKPRALKLTI